MAITTFRATNVVGSIGANYLEVRMAESSTTTSKTGGRSAKDVLRFIPGILSVILGIVILTTKTPSVTTRFGADFYTECYQAIADVAVLLKYGFGFLLLALGIRWLCCTPKAANAVPTKEQTPEPKAEDQLPSV